MSKKFKPFSNQDAEKIKAEYLTKPVKRLAAELGTTYGRIMRFLDRNNLELPKSLIEQRKKASQHKKGHTPFNKGKYQTDYMTPEAIERTKATRFKQGDTPHNINKLGNGAVVRRKDRKDCYYNYIRVSKSVWHLHHRVIWEKAHGKIPKTHVVIFKDGNTENTSLGNLDMITKIENMLRNSNFKYPKEVIPSMVLAKQISNKLKILTDGKQ